MADEIRWTQPLTETCPWCRNTRTWSSHSPAAVYTPPSGHTIHVTPDGSRYDTCPQEGTLRMPPGGPLQI